MAARCITQLTSEYETGRKIDGQSYVADTLIYALGRAENRKCHIYARWRRYAEASIRYLTWPISRHGGAAAGRTFLHKSGCVRSGIDSNVQIYDHR